MRGLLAVVACGATALIASGCESTESESASLGREGAKLIAGAGTVGLGAANRSVHVGRVALVQGSGRTAAAVELTATGAGAELNVPVLIDVRDRTGGSVYRNDIQGLEPSLQEMPSLRPHRPEWWVDDQVLAAGRPSSVKVRVGVAKGSAGSAGRHGARDGARASLVAAAARVGGVQIGGVRIGRDLAGPYLSAGVVNRTGIAQHNMPIFAVALRGGRVVAAGRALVPSLPPGGRPTAFRIYLVGSPAGARIELTPAPSELTPGPRELTPAPSVAK